MSLGATLRQARTARKLACEHLSSTTRIPLRIIVAMEQDEWTKVPGGLFARGYLRAYAREVGLDGEALAAQYAAEHAPPQVPDEEAGSIAEAGTSRAVLRLRLPSLPDTSRRWLTGTATIGLLLLVYAAGRWSAGDAGVTPERQDPVVAEQSANALGGEAARPTGTSAHVTGAVESPLARDKMAAGGAGGRNIALPSPSLPDAPLVVDVAVVRPCWVTVSADGTRTIYRLLQPGERVQARGRVLTFRVGDAGALQLSLDGEPARPLGASGEVVNVRITRENYRALLQARAGT
jgi:cytoskeletal protein RodZ